MPVPLRLALGFGMAYHGFPKLFVAAQREGLVGMLGGMGMPAPGALAWGVGALELVGGSLVVLGALTRVLSALFIVEMLVAAFLVHLPSGFGFMNITGTGPAGPEFGMPGYEVNVLYVAGFLALLIGGAGLYSIDGLVRRRAATVPGARPARHPGESLPERRPRWRTRAPRPPAT